jgi:hypothetical protein
MQTNPFSTDARTYSPTQKKNIYQTNPFSSPRVDLLQLAINADITQTTDISGHW